MYEYKTKSYSQVKFSDDKIKFKTEMILIYIESAKMHFEYMHNTNIFQIGFGVISKAKRYE